MKQLIYFNFILFNSIYTSNANELNCHLPENCRIEGIYTSGFSFFYYSFILCDINNDGFEFKFKEPTPLITAGKKCFMSKFYLIVFRWISNDLIILDKQFNFTNMIRYFGYFDETSLEFSINIINLKGFDINFLGEKKYSFDKNYEPNIYINNCLLDFYHNKKKLNSCQDFLDSNVTEIKSIFQQMYQGNKTTYIFELKNVEYKQKTCPIVFKNSRIKYLMIEKLIDTFYKKNVLTFSNEVNTELNSKITRLNFIDSVNINLDLNIIHPSVFNYTKEIFIINNYNSLNSISGDIFEHLKNLKTISLNGFIFRKISHKQGIKWIRQWNNDLNVNLSNILEICSSFKEIKITTSLEGLTLSQVFPEEDFCVFVDFPFNQLIIIYNENLYKNEKFTSTCTYLWLIQYYRQYQKIYKDTQSFDLMKIVNSSEFKSISKCDFEQKISYCNKSNYKIKDIWDRSDFFILNQKLQIPIKILLYPIAFLGLITNIIVVVVIQFKDNTDLFKEYKQYSYLCLNSIFCIMISLVEILSWMTECFYPYQVFCPEIRKLVAIQLFKIIFKECLVTAFRFMCNFTYVAFALNRISLIGKDHGKLVTFFSETGIKIYIGTTILISASFSWIFFFKYKINFYNYFEDFPSLTENLMHKSGFSKAYYILSSLSSFVNYFLFVVICAIIDICMVVQLRRTLNEKAEKSESMMNKKQNEIKKAENEEAVNKAIKMVVLNTVIGIFFKLPVSFIPILNFFAEFNSHPLLLISFLFVSGFYNFIQDVSNLLFILSLSIQIFIYHRFDKKFREGYQRLKEKTVRKIKNVFKSSF